MIPQVGEFVELDSTTIEVIGQQAGGDPTKVVNLIKSIERAAEEDSDDPFLVTMADRARTIRDTFESRQTSTANALSALIAEVRQNERRKEAQAGQGLDSITFYVRTRLEEEGVSNAEEVLTRIGEAFVTYSSWRTSEADLRGLRQQFTFAILRRVENIDRVTQMVDALFEVLLKRAG